MGIDHIFVDESHQFKNLMFNTRHDRVAGFGNSEGSRPNELERQEIRCFDAWAAIFAKKTTDFEFNVTNLIVQKERFQVLHQRCRSWLLSTTKSPTIALLKM